MSDLKSITKVEYTEEHIKMAVHEGLMEIVEGVAKLGSMYRLTAKGRELGQTEDVLKAMVQLAKSKLPELHVTVFPGPDEQLIKIWHYPEPLETALGKPLLDAIHAWMEGRR